MKNNPWPLLPMLLSLAMLASCATSVPVGRVVKAPEQPKPLIPASLQTPTPAESINYITELQTALTELAEALRN